MASTSNCQDHENALDEDAYEVTDWVTPQHKMSTAVSSPLNALDEDVYEDTAWVTPQHESSIAVPPPLPPRDIGDLSLVGNPSYQQKKTSNPNILHSSSPPPPYDYVSTTILKSPKPRVKKTSVPGLKDMTVSKSLPSKKSLSIDAPGSHTGAATDPTKSLPVSMPSYSESGEGIKAKQKASSKLNISTPTGYNVLLKENYACECGSVYSTNQLDENLLWKGNVIYLVSVGSEDKLPLTISGKTVRGGGSYNDDSKFEVVVVRTHSTECVVALRSVKHKERFLCINSKGKIKARDGYKDSCDFFVNVLGDTQSSIVYFESARSDGFYLGVKSNGTVANAPNIVPEAKEAQFIIIADTIQESAPTQKLQVFGTDSVMNQIHDRSVVRLYSHRRYLAVDKKGRIIQTHNSDNQECWFIMFNRGMGVISLRSYNYSGNWLKIQDGQLLGKGVLGPDAFFIVKESASHLLCFESLLQPGNFVAPPLRNTDVTYSHHEFTLEVIQ